MCADEGPARSRADVYISVDIEADGPAPGMYSMLTCGLAVAARWHDGGLVPELHSAPRLYVELQPISPRYVPEMLAVTGLDRDRLAREGMPPSDAMATIRRWVLDVSDSGTPVFVAYPASYDWMFLQWYFVRYASEGSPFSHASVLDIKTLYACRAAVTVSDAHRGAMPREVLARRQTTHNALEDAVTQAELFLNLMRWRGPGGP